MFKNLEDFKIKINGKKIAFIGAGVSNLPMIDYVIKYNAIVSVFDKRNYEDISDIIDGLKSKNVSVYLGENYLDDLTGFDIIFRSPSMRIDNPYLVKNKNNGAYITSEMEEFIKFCKAKIYAITGSDGKTTTTSIVTELLKNAGYKTWTGGNIGTPLFTKLDEIKENDKVVLELSSFQLMSINNKIDIALITNITPNHLDIHKDMQEYIDCKKNIFLNQDNNSTLIVNENNEITRKFKSLAKGKVYSFSSSNSCADIYFDGENIKLQNKNICSSSDISVKGIHNIENFMAAFLSVKDDVTIDVMKNTAKSFNGVAHRCEFVKEINKVKYYNDSIASTPTRTLAGLKAFDKPVILLAGGYDKNLSFDELAFDGHNKIKSIILFGNTKYKIKDSFDKLKEEKGIEVDLHIANTMREAIDISLKISEKKDIVTLSPACASFDMFKNFEERGNTFKAIINNI